MTGLANSRLGRVLLHALCFFRHPDRAQWHWQGILRELIPGRAASSAPVR
jgi:hypothetical protein